VWARLHLGRFWSSAIVTKHNHRVVDTGPYRLVRHPIYSGVIFCALATAAAKGTALAVLGGLVIAVGLSVRARSEEDFLRAELGAETYDSYARRVPRLMPRLPEGLFRP
jgi:protein-S-isoprenylcysteine O-methyltransferase Ste14